MVSTKIDGANGWMTLYQRVLKDSKQTSEHQGNYPDGDGVVILTILKIIGARKYDVVGMVDMVSRIGRLCYSVKNRPNRMYLSSTSGMKEDDNFSGVVLY